MLGPRFPIDVEFFRMGDFGAIWIIEGGKSPLVLLAYVAVCTLFCNVEAPFADSRNTLLLLPRFDRGGCNPETTLFLLEKEPVARSGSCSIAASEPLPSAAAVARLGSAGPAASRDPDAPAFCEDCDRLDLEDFTERVDLPDLTDCDVSVRAKGGALSRLTLFF